MLPLECYNVVVAKWPSDMVFDPALPTFSLLRDFIMKIILTKFREDMARIWLLECSQVFFYYLIRRPNFEPVVYQDNHSKQFTWSVTTTCTSRVFTSNCWRRTTHDGHSNVTKIHPELSSVSQNHDTMIQYKLYYSIGPNFVPSDHFPCFSLVYCTQLMDVTFRLNACKTIIPSMRESR